MAGRRKLVQKDLKKIVDLAEAGKTMKDIIAATGWTQGVIGPVLVYCGARKSRPSIVEFETSKVERWLAAAKPAKANGKKKSATKTTAKK